MQLVTRKIRKGQYGLSTPSFSNVGNAFSNAVKPNLNFQTKMGDMTALSLVTNQSLGQGVKSSSSSFVNPVGGDSAGPTSSKGMNSGMSAGLGAAGQLLGSVYDAVPTLDQVHNSNDQASQDIRSGVNKALLSGAAGPWGMLAGAINMGIDKTGGFTDASKGLGGANDALNMVASLAIPGAGWFTKKTIDYDISDTLKQSGASYSGTLDKANTAAQNAGAKILFGKSKANSMIGKAILADTKVQNIVSENELAQAGANNPLIGLRNQFNMQGGWQQGAISYGRRGMSIQILERTKNIISNIKNNHKSDSSPVEYIDDIAEVTLYDDIPKHKNGGSIIELTPVPTEILLVNPADIPEFQEGGTISQKIKDYDLDKVVVMQGEPRTESDTIYANNDEDQAHELWHWISQNRSNENLKYFYDNLNDQRIQELGGDLDFVKRTGDPGNFYHPSEIEARLKAAKFMSQGQRYTKDFFSNLRKNENKYGYNMRDLLHMYSDDNLEKLFNTSLQSFKDGGGFNKKSRTLEELIQYAKEVNPRFIQRMSEPLKYVEWDDNEGHHFGTHELGYAEMDGKYFVYPSIQESNDGNLIRYTPEDWKQAVDNAYKNKNGLFFDTEEEAKIFTESQENPDGTFSGYKSGWSEFFKQRPTKYQNGGSINVIPDGALHARKHNMDMDGITKKGIPVVADKENGEIEQQAEIEKEEIIFRLEVTKKLEELEKKYYNSDTSQKEKDELALEAGKLLVQEILYNTMDNVNLIDKV